MTPKLIGFIRRAASIGIRGQRMVSRKPLIISGRRLRDIRITRWRTRVWRRCASVSRLELTDVRRGENSTRSDDIVDSRVFQVKIARGPQELLKHMRADLTTYHKAVPARSAEVNPGVDTRVRAFLRRLREVVAVLGAITGDQAIGAGKMEQGEKARAIP